jgi:hypothetical protein
MIIPCRSHFCGRGKEGMYAVLGDGGKDVSSALSVKSSIRTSAMALFCR